MPPKKEKRKTTGAGEGSAAAAPSTKPKENAGRAVSAAASVAAPLPSFASRSPDGRLEFRHLDFLSKNLNPPYSPEGSESNARHSFRPLPLIPGFVSAGSAVQGPSLPTGGSGATRLPSSESGAGTGRDEGVLETVRAISELATSTGASATTITTYDSPGDINRALTVIGSRLHAEIEELQEKNAELERVILGLRAELTQYEKRLAKAAETSLLTVEETQGAANKQIERLQDQLVKQRREGKAEVDRVRAAVNSQLEAMQQQLKALEEEARAAREKVQADLVQKDRRIDELVAALTMAQARERQEAARATTLTEALEVARSTARVEAAKLHGTVQELEAENAHLRELEGATQTAIKKLQKIVEITQAKLAAKASELEAAAIAHETKERAAVAVSAVQGERIAALQAQVKTLLKEKLNRATFAPLRFAAYLTPALQYYLENAFPESGRLSKPHKAQFAREFLQGLRTIYSYILALEKDPKFVSPPELDGLKKQCQALAALFISESEWEAYVPIALPPGIDLSREYNALLCYYAGSLISEDDGLLLLLLAHFAHFPLQNFEGIHVTTIDILYLQKTLFVELKNQGGVVLHGGTGRVAQKEARDVDIIYAQPGDAAGSFAKFLGRLSESETWGAASSAIDGAHQQIKLAMSCTAHISPRRPDIDIKLMGIEAGKLNISNSCRQRRVAPAAVLASPETGQAVVDLDAALAAIVEHRFIVLNIQETEKAFNNLGARFRARKFDGAGANDGEKEDFSHVCFVLKHMARFLSLGWSLTDNRKEAGRDDTHQTRLLKVYDDFRIACHEIQGSMPKKIADLLNAAFSVIESLRACPPVPVAPPILVSIFVVARKAGSYSTANLHVLGGKSGFMPPESAAGGAGAHHP